MHVSRTAAVLLAFCLLAGATLPARAYLDPGSGSMLLQLILAGVAGALVLLKMYWRRLRTRLGVRKKEP